MKPELILRFLTPGALHPVFYLNDVWLNGMTGRRRDCRDNGVNGGIWAALMRAWRGGMQGSRVSDFTYKNMKY
jgi:hypothetical protein